MQSYHAMQGSVQVVQKIPWFVEGTVVRKNGPSDSCIVGQKTTSKINQNDKQVLKQLILKRLGERAVEQTWARTNTNKVEAVHRCYTKTSPKAITSTRNFIGRISAAVMLVNLGLEQCTLLLQAAVGHFVSDDVKKMLKARHRNMMNMKRIAKLDASRIKRSEKTVANFRLHEATKSKPQETCKNNSYMSSLNMQ